MTALFGEPANPEYAGSFRRVGGYGELAVGYRSSYFIDPLISVGYASLAGGDAQLPDGPWGDGGKLEQHLGAWFISPGLTADLWRFRLRFGIGVAVVQPSFRYAGVDSSSSQIAIMNQLGIGFNAIDADRFRLDGEVRFVNAAGADLAFMSFNLIMRGDVIVFGGK
jgi:hypothetical protein